MTEIEEGDEVSNADTDDRDSGFCDDTFIDDRLDIIEKMVQDNHSELVKVGDNIFLYISRVNSFRFKLRWWDLTKLLIR